MGRPRKNPDIDKITEWIDRYVDGSGQFKIESITDPPTINGLAWHLGYCSKQSLYDKAGDKDQAISRPVRRAMMIVERWHERGLSAGQCTGHIFGLKNAGWKDKTETEHSGTLSIAQQIIGAYRTHD
jgi:hypothetical protein